MHMFSNRIRELRSNLKEQQLDAALISSVPNITYLTGFANFSKDEREAYIFIGSDFAYIITDGRYTEAVKRNVAHLTIFERGNGKSADNLFKKHRKEINQLGIEENNLTVAEHKILSRHFKNTKHFDVSNLRSVKTKEEISKIEKACKIGDLAFNHILKKIKIGISEKEIVRELEDFVRSKGVVLSFPAIVAFGKNSSVPHHQTGNTKLTEEDKFILLDFGVEYENYCSDMTRTIFFGKPTERQKKIYKTVLEAQQRAVDFLSSAIKLGKKVRVSKVDKVARDYIISKGYLTIPHSLGHGIGLEVHEHPSLSPHSKDILKEGMVFSIEPGIYLPNFGGVRVEDLFVLKKNTLKQLTRSPKKLTVV